jgi:hypothetical protein
MFLDFYNTTVSEIIHTDFTKAYCTFKMSYHFIVHKFNFICAQMKTASLHAPIFMILTDAE